MFKHSAVIYSAKPVLKTTYKARVCFYESSGHFLLQVRRAANYVKKLDKPLPTHAG